MIEKSTLDFLVKLKKNNNKEWFDKNRDIYESAKKNYYSFINELIQSISKFDPSIKMLDAKQCVFRINRDIRFSNDKTPYKTNMGADISPEKRLTLRDIIFISNPEDLFLPVESGNRPLRS
jgi:uncharacterized protein (TIGR02453 family)